MSLENYILFGHTPVPEPDILKWAAWFENIENRVVAKDRIGDAEVSTVFLGIDHNHRDEPGAAPVLFETMIFGGPRDGLQWRYPTWDEAVAGHRAAVLLAQKPVIES